MSRSRPCGGLFSRRKFLWGAGAALGGGFAYLAGRYSVDHFREHGTPFSGRSSENARALGMPGPFAGRVVEVRHRGSVDERNRIQNEPVKDMMREGMCRLVGSGDDVAAAWRRLFQRGDVVGIKVNPVGQATLARPDAVGSISSPPVVVDIVRSLREYCNIPPKDIILFERYADAFRDAGYEALMTTRHLDGCRWYASSYAYDESQLSINGQGRERDPNVVGYDPDVFVSMGFAAPVPYHAVFDKQYDRFINDERRFRSHLSTIVTRMTNKIINVPCLKDHKSSGITIALKNMSHGMNNNVCRSHLHGIYRFSQTAGSPNQCNTFIPTAVGQRPLMEKATLHICDGLIGVYEGGPGNWNRAWATWPHRGLFFATDPVAMDHVGWDIIDRKRAEMGWAPVGNMGAAQAKGRMYQLPPNLIAAMAANPSLANVALLEENRRNLARPGFVNEPFEQRQPEHIALAGLLGLGHYLPNTIDHRIVTMA